MFTNGWYCDDHYGSDYPNYYGVKEDSILMGMVLLLCAKLLRRIIIRDLLCTYEKSV
jgi:hypothetical protein